MSLTDLQKNKLDKQTALEYIVQQPSTDVWVCGVSLTIANVKIGVDWGKENISGKKTFNIIIEAPLRKHLKHIMKAQCIQLPDSTILSQ